MGCVFSKNTDAELHNVTFDCESPKETLNKSTVEKANR